MAPDFQSLPTAARKVSELAALLRCFCGLLVTLAVLGLLHSSGSFDGVRSPRLMALAIASPALLLSLYTLIWPGLKWRHTRWRLTDLAIELNSGVIWRREMTVPRARIQHTEVSEGPLQRRHDLASLTVYTAGERYAEVTIVGLEAKVASELRDQLLNRATDHAV